MEKQQLHLSITIQAPKEIIWDVLLQDETYRQWTAVFHPGSYAVTDWSQGSKVLFATPEGNGLVSKVRLHRPAEVISIEHMGLLKNNKEDFDSEEVKHWQGFTETYRLMRDGNEYHLIIEQDMLAKDLAWFKDTWQKALQKIKELSETNENGRGI